MGRWYIIKVCIQYIILMHVSSCTRLILTYAYKNSRKIQNKEWLSWKKIMSTRKRAFHASYLMKEGSKEVTLFLWTKLDTNGLYYSYYFRELALQIVTSFKLLRIEGICKFQLNIMPYNINLLHYESFKKIKEIWKVISY